MSTGILLPFTIAALGLYALYLAAMSALERPDASLRQIIGFYGRWYQELADYLLDRTSARRFALFHGGSVLLGWVLGYLLSQSALLTLVGAALGGTVPVLILHQRRQTRREQLQQQVDPALQFLANTLAVNPNVENALHLVSAHFKPPIALEFGQVVSAYRLGQRMDDALQAMSERCRDPYVTALVVALRVGRRAGGDLAETMRRIAQSTRESVRMEQDLKSKTRGQRNQFYVVLFLYPLTLLALKSAQPETWQQLVTTDAGRLTLCASIAVVIAASVWAHHILHPKNW